MINFWGKKRVETSLGQVADFCPICRDLRPFELFRAGMAGQLLGHVKQCHHCGLKLGADPAQYASVAPLSPTSLEVLVARTFPGIWMKYADRLKLEEDLRRQPGAVAPEAKEGYLMEPWVLFNGVVEQLFAGKAPLDLPSGFGCLGTLVLAIPLLVLAALARDLPTKYALLLGLLLVLVGGAGFTLWQLSLRPQRYVRRKIVPFLALALKPLAPTRPELEACFNKCRNLRMKIATAIPLEQIWPQLEQPQSPPPRSSSAASYLVPTAVLLGCLLFLGGGFIFLHYSPQSQNASNNATLPVAIPARPAKAVEANARLAAAQPTNAVGFFVPAPRRTDMVHDPKRNLLYIAADDVVLRYQMASRTFLPPLQLGGDLRAIDLSLDNDSLVVADASRHGGNIAIHLVALDTGVRSLVSFPAEPQETGAFSVVFGADGSVWITSSMHGSGGAAPLRKYVPSSRRVTVLAHLAPDTMLAASANREYIAYACANDPAGNFGWFRCRAFRLPPPLQANARLFEVGISRDGSQLALPNDGGVTLSGASVPGLPETNVIGVAYHPQQDFLFLARSGQSTIEVLDTVNFAPARELDFGRPFAAIGNHAFVAGRLRLSPDGRFIFCTVPGGVRYVELPH